MIVKGNEWMLGMHADYMVITPDSMVVEQATYYGSYWLRDTKRLDNVIEFALMDDYGQYELMYDTQPMPHDWYGEI